MFKLNSYIARGNSLVVLNVVNIAAMTLQD